MNKLAEQYLARHQEDFDAPWRLWVEPFQIEGNLYFVGNKDGASHLVDTGNGLILFDTNYPSAAPLLFHSIWKIGFNPEQICAIFHTHGHFDHFGATAMLCALTGAKTYIGEQDSRMMRERPELTLMEKNTPTWTALFTPDVELKDGDVITIGRTTVRAIDTSGHSPGAMSYMFNVDSGDHEYIAGLHGGAGFNTLSREFERTYQTGSLRENFWASFKRLETEHVDIFLGNHTNQSNTLEKRASQIAKGGNPFIDERAWKRYLESLSESFSAFVREDP